MHFQFQSCCDSRQRTLMALHQRVSKGHACRLTRLFLDVSRIMSSQSLRVQCSCIRTCCGLFVALSCTIAVMAYSNNCRLVFCATILLYITPLPDFPL